MEHKNIPYAALDDKALVIHPLTTVAVPYQDRISKLRQATLLWEISDIYVSFKICLYLTPVCITEVQASGYSMLVLF